MEALKKGDHEMENESLRILKLVESGKISADEAEKLLAAISKSSDKPDLVKAKTGKLKWLKIRVYQGDAAKPKVNISLPLSLVKVVTKILPKSAKIQLDEKNINLEEILAAIDENTGGKILEVHDEEDNEHVEIVIE
jgi:hypothetical protein